MSCNCVYGQGVHQWLNSESTLIQRHDVESTLIQCWFTIKCQCVHRGSYTRCHFIWNLSNEHSASFINFIRNDHECHDVMTLNQCWFTIMCQCVHRGSYTSGHFVWNLWNETSASFINFIRSDHECKIPFIKWAFKMAFYRRQNEHKFHVETHCWHGRCQWRYVNAPKCYYTCVHTILWHDVIHWKTAPSYDKCKIEIQQSILHVNAKKGSSANESRRNYVALDFYCNNSAGLT